MNSKGFTKQYIYCELAYSLAYSALHNANPWETHTHDIAALPLQYTAAAQLCETIYKEKRPRHLSHIDANVNDINGLPVGSVLAKRADEIKNHAN